MSTLPGRMVPAQSIARRVERTGSEPAAPARIARGPQAQRSALDQLRAEALAETAPWLAALSGVCAVAVLWALLGHVPVVALGAWAALVIAVNLVSVRARARAVGFASGLIGQSAYWSVFEAAVHAGLWSALPVLAFPSQPPATQLLLGGAVLTMIAGSALLTVIPLAATVWAGILAIGLVVAVQENVASALPVLSLLLPVYLAVVLVGCLAVERLLARHMVVAAEERQRRESIGLLLKEYEEQGIGWLWQTDAANQLTYVSPRICNLLGRSTQQLLGQSIAVVLGCDSRLGAALVAREPFTALEIEVQTINGPRCIAISGSPVITSRGEFQGFRGVGADVTEVRRSQERLTQLASIDVLTGLPNRQRMRELLAEAIGRAESGGSPCAILFLDLDGFKPVNDTFGHSIGDAVLRAAAQRMARELGDRGQVGRLGGDEFALLVTDGSSRHAIEELGMALVAAMSEPFAFEGTEIRIGVSIGSAIAPLDGNSVDDLLVKADLALYQAKSRGRGRICQFDADMQREAEDRARLEKDLRHALEREEFRVYYQPIVSAQTQAVLGFEALLRWQHPTRGLVPPDRFVPLAEETGLIAEIGEWVIRTACRDAMEWPEDTFVSVNLSPRQLVLPALPAAISEALAVSRLQPNRLELEVTESVFMSDADGSLDVLRRVRALGCGIALDDFGTGYSSLGYLNKTIFHTLKIDGSFVRDAAHKPETVAIIQAIVTLAASFRMKITAEGVETREDFERMRELGCDKIQGYLFGKPMPQADALAMVGTRWDRVARLG